MRRNPQRLGLWLILIMGIFPGALWAQQEARSLALGEAYTAVARGPTSSFYNPANLGLSDRPRGEFKIFGFGLGLDNNSFEYGDYTRYNGKHLSESDKEKILSSIPDGGLNLRAFTGLEALSLSYRNFAVNFSGWGYADVELPKEPLELILYGNAEKRQLVLDDVQGESYALACASFCCGYPALKNGRLEVAVGAGLHYLRGIACAQILNAEAEATTTDTSLSARGEIDIRTALGGKGYSADLGLAMRLGDNWTFGLSLLRLWEKMKWNRETEMRVYAFKVKPLNAETIDDDSVATSEETVLPIEPFCSRRSAIIRSGVAYRTEKMLLSADLVSSLGSSLSGRSGTNFGAGFEYRLLPWLPLRTGFSFGGFYGSFASFGWGLDFGSYSFDFALANYASLLPGDAKGLGISISNRLSF